MSFPKIGQIGQKWIKGGHTFLHLIEMLLSVPNWIKNDKYDQKWKILITSRHRGELKLNQTEQT